MALSRRKLVRVTLSAFLVPLLAACDSGQDSIAPDQRTPATGTYAYSGVFSTSDSTADTLSGSFGVTFANRDSLVATWNVPGLVAAPVKAFWNINAYVAQANSSLDNGRLTHRIWRAANGSDMNCAGGYERVVAPADTFTAAVTCSLTRNSP